MRLARAWETLMLLVESPAALTAQEINRRVHRDYPFCDHPCSVQTTREDLKTLQKGGFPLVMVDDQDCEIDPEILETTHGRLKNVRWRMRENPAPDQAAAPNHRNPTQTDLITLSLCRALLHDDMLPRGYPLYRMAGRLLEALQLRLNQALRTGEPEIADLPGKIQILGRRFVGKAVEADEWATVAAAISQRQVLSGAYRNRDDETKEVLLAPLAVWFAEGRAYLLAAGAKDQKIRTWRLERLTNLQAAPDHSAPEIPEATVQEQIKASFKGFVAPPEKIRLRVDPRAAYLFHEFQYHPSQQTTEQPDGSLEVRLECTTGWGLEEWLLGFGELVTVCEPETLKTRLQDRLLAALAQYR